MTNLIRFASVDSGMTYSFFDHTGDIAVRLDAGTPGQLFESAAAAFTDAVTDPPTVRPHDTIQFDLESSSLDLLLVDFLTEILYRFEVDQFLCARSDVRLASTSTAWRLHSTLHGETFDERRHQIKVLIKAVTYHALEVGEDARGWHATVVFDI